MATLAGKVWLNKSGDIFSVISWVLSDCKRTEMEYVAPCPAEFSVGALTTLFPSQRHVEV